MGKKSNPACLLTTTFHLATSLGKGEAVRESNVGSPAWASPLLTEVQAISALTVFPLLSDTQ